MSRWITEPASLGVELDNLSASAGWPAWRFRQHSRFETRQPGCNPDSRLRLVFPVSGRRTVCSNSIMVSLTLAVSRK